MKIVFIHGRSQENKNPAELEKRWTDALYEGFQLAGLEIPENLEIAFPYYGDLLFKETEKAARDSFNVLMDKGADAAAPSAEEIEFTQNIVREMAHAKGLSDADIAKEVEGDLVEKGVQNWRVVLAMFRAVEKNSDVASVFIEIFVRDTWYYLTKTGVRLVVNQFVDKHIPNDTPCIVVAHSLGSIVGYNLLADRKGKSKIKAFITLGSPLGIEAIYSRLPSGGPPRRSPEGVDFWFNARDAGDVVALHEIPDGRFMGNPVVKNYSEVDNSSPNQHGIVEYLKDGAVARAIHDAVYML